jgi:hypothetical protein
MSAHDPHAAPVAFPSGPFDGGRRVMMGAGAAGAAGLLLTALGTFISPREALFSYLFAYVYWVGLAVGSLLLLLAWHASNARWSVVLRRIVEDHAAAIAVFVVLFIPVALGMKTIFVWLAPERLPPADLELVHQKHSYLNAAAFLVRAFIYFAVWIAVAYLLRGWSLRQDKEVSAALTLKQRRLGAGSLPFVGLAMTFAAFDWLMSLDPVYASTIFGLYYFAGSFLGAIAILIVASWQLKKHGALGDAVNVDHLHSLGMFMFAFTCFWAYMAYSQGMLNWVANLPHETRFYLARMKAGFGGIGIFLILFHFIVPFFILLSRNLKRTPPALQAMAIYILIVHAVDIYWVVMPAMPGATAVPHWTVFTAFVGVGGIAVAFAVHRYRGHPLIPLGDPYLEDSLRYQQP